MLKLALLRVNSPVLNDKLVKIRHISVLTFGRRVLEVNGFFAYDERAFGRPEKGISRLEISGTIVRRRAVKQDMRISTFDVVRIRPGVRR